eukprot:205663-Chlamydomonas_euryale.AAC.2
MLCIDGAPTAVEPVLCLDRVRDRGSCMPDGILPSSAAAPMRRSFDKSLPEPVGYRGCAATCRAATRAVRQRVPRRVPCALVVAAAACTVACHDLEDAAAAAAIASALRGALLFGEHRGGMMYEAVLHRCASDARRCDAAPALHNNAATRSAAPSVHVCERAGRTSTCSRRQLRPGRRVCARRGRSSCCDAQEQEPRRGVTVLPRCAVELRGWLAGLPACRRSGCKQIRAAGFAPAFAPFLVAACKRAQITRTCAHALTHIHTYSGQAHRACYSWQLPALVDRRRPDVAATQAGGGASRADAYAAAANVAPPATRMDTVRRADALVDRGQMPSR